MIRAIFWKEYREQRIIGATLFFLTLLAMTAMYQWKVSEGPGQYEAMNESALEISLSLAFLSGLVIGAMLLAEEEESRTQSFLDVLPTWRIGLWKGKVVFGLAAVLVQVALIGILNVVLGFIPERFPTLVALGLLVSAAICSFAAGLLGSALCRNVLSAIGLALVVQLFAGLIGGVLVALLEIAFFGGIGKGNPVIAIALAAVILVPATLIGSLLAYSRTDFRGSARRLYLPVVASQTRTVRNWRVMLWLVWRQGRTAFLILAFICLVCGFLVRADGFAIWPLVSLLVGLVCGLAAFMGEQSTGSEIFLGTERIPASRFWLYKVGLWSFLLLLLACMFWIVPVIRGAAWWSSSAHMENAPQMVGALVLGLPPQLLPLIDAGTFAGLWLLHGFAIGQVFALACRKTVVAGFLSIGACMAIAAFWWPSVLFGGLHFWQVLGAPVILLIGSRLAYWPWIGNRLSSWRPLASQITCGLLAVAWIGGQLAYRVLEVPTPPEPYSVTEFVANLPTAEKNLAGRTISTAGDELYKLLKVDWRKSGTSGMSDQEEFTVDFLNQGPVGHPDATRIDSRITLEQELLEVATKGWGKSPKNHQELGKWLDRLFMDTWQKSAQAVRAASDLPLGVLIDPAAPPRAVKHFEIMTDSTWIVNVFVARGRQLQVNEDFQEAWEHYFHALSLTRHMRNQAILMAFQGGLSSEDIVVRAIDSWLSDLSRSTKLSTSNRSSLLRIALEGLRRHETALPSLEDALKAEFLVTRNSIYDPETINNLIARETRSMAISLALKNRLLAILPWEMNRVDRLLEAVFAGWQRTLLLDYPNLMALQKSDRLGESGAHRDNFLGRFLLTGWSPPENDARGKQSRERLATLVNQSWLRNVIFPRFAPLALAVQENLRRIRLLRIKLALEGYQISHESGDQSISLHDLMPEFPEGIPLDPHTNQPFTQTDLNAFIKSRS